VASPLQPSGAVKLAAVLVAAIAGVALAVWGVVGLVPVDLSASAARVRSAGPPGAERLVRSVRFRGDLDPAGLRGQLRTQIGHPVRAADLAADRVRVEAALVARGHLDARVGAPDLGPSGTDVVWPIAAGPLYRVRAVHLAGRIARRFPQLAQQLTVGAGDEVSARAIAATQDRLATWLRGHGVGPVVVRHRLRIDRAATRVDVDYDVEPALAVAGR
jgi:hypothetical protein